MSIFFSLICLCLYEWGLYRKEKLRRYLENKIETLHLEKQQEKKTHRDLTEELLAHEDPKWTEMTLKKTLGVIRKGEIKVIFLNQEE